MEEEEEGGASSGLFTGFALADDGDLTGAGGVGLDGEDCGGNEMI